MCSCPLNTAALNAVLSSESQASMDAPFSSKILTTFSLPLNKIELIS